MEIRDYCTNMGMELTVWKARLYDLMSKMDKLPTGDKEKMYEHVNALHIILTELEDRVDSLRTDCPTEWSALRDDINSKLADLTSNYNDTAHTYFDYEFGG